MSVKDDGLLPDIPTKWNGFCEGAGEDFNSSLCNYKLLGARYFNDGLKKERLRNWEGKDLSRDDMGHETYVSSIAIGNYITDASYFDYMVKELPKA